MADQIDVNAEDQIDVNAEDRTLAPGKSAQPRWGRRLLTLLIATAAVGGFAVVVAYSYDKGHLAGNDKAVPIITAKKGPTKMRPKEPGGMVVPNRDKQVYGRLNIAERRDKIERLLPPPETVVSKPAAMPTRTAPSNRVAMAQQKTEQMTKKLAAIEPAAGISNASPPAAPVIGKLAQKSMKIAKLAVPAKNTAMPTGAVFRIQLASLRSQKAAEQAWGRYKFIHAELFGKLESKIVRVYLKGRGTYYRLQAGPLADASAARSLCSQAKKRKIGCIIVRP